MADPFEVRMRFTNLLGHLSASSTALMKAAHYALKHRDMDEDLHSCILENLERGHNMNNRANIMYFLEHHADANMRDGGHEPYVDMVRRDIARIVEAVAQSGANVKVVRRVVVGLGEKGVLTTEIVADLETGLKEKEEKMSTLLGEEDESVNVASRDQDKEMLDVPSETAADAGRSGHRHSGPQHSTKSNGVSKVDKRAIEQRIEEDRERNKRLRESVWAVTGDDDQEFDKMWDESSDLGDEDYVIAQEEAEERRQFARYHRAVLDA